MILLKLFLATYIPARGFSSSCRRTGREGTVSRHGEREEERGAHIIQVGEVRGVTERVSHHRVEERPKERELNFNS